MPWESTLLREHNSKPGKAYKKPKHNTKKRLEFLMTNPSTANHQRKET